MQAFIDKTGCISCGLCVSICPVVFAMDDDGKAVAIVNEVPQGSTDEAKEAKDACPASVVILEY